MLHCRSELCFEALPSSVSDSAVTGTVFAQLTHSTLVRQGKQPFHRVRTKMIPFVLDFSAPGAFVRLLAWRVATSLAGFPAKFRKRSVFSTCPSQFSRSSPAMHATEPAEETSSFIKTSQQACVVPLRTCALRPRGGMDGKHDGRGKDTASVSFRIRSCTTAVDRADARATDPYLRIKTCTSYASVSATTSTTRFRVLRRFASARRRSASPSRPCSNRWGLSPSPSHSHSLTH